MVGLKACGFYVPLYRLAPGVSGWKRATTRAVASFDEDSITMGVAAAIDCLDSLDRKAIDGLYFASTTPPYLEKQAASIVAIALDLRDDILTADFGGSLRAGTIALRCAIDTVRAGSAKQLLVVAADNRQAVAGSELESLLGDGAAAILVADSDVAVDVEYAYAVNHEIFDIWRAQGDVTLDTAEGRFGIEEGYLAVIPQVASAVLSKQSLTPADFARLVLYAPDARRQKQLAKQLGFDAQKQLQDGFLTDIGNTGVASTLMMLVGALQDAKAGDRILMLNYGSGGDALILLTTENTAGVRKREGLKARFERKKELENYLTYARWRGLIEMASAVTRPPPRIPSPAALWREQNKNLRLLGSRCKQCGHPQFPLQRICAYCHSKDDFELERFSDKKGKIFTYTLDYMTDIPAPPLIIAWVDFEGGGRMTGVLTDVDIKDVQIGMPVQMAFKKIRLIGGIHNYYWKFIPV